MPYALKSIVVSNLLSLNHVVLSSEVKGLQKNYTVLCRLQCMWTQQLNNQLALKGIYLIRDFVKPCPLDHRYFEWGKLMSFY